MIGLGAIGSLVANAALNMGSVTDQLDWFRSEGLIKDSITVETLVDQSYAEMV